MFRSLNEVKREVSIRFLLTLDSVLEFPCSCVPPKLLRRIDLSLQTGNLHARLYEQMSPNLAH